MSEADGAPEVLSAAWCAEHFDHLEPLVGRNLQDTLATLRAGGGLTHSDQHGGFWVATGYEEVLAIAQDWESFSSEHGITVPSGQTSVPAIPEQLDPPRHREFKRLINAHFTPLVVLEREADTRALVTELIDDVIDAGECDFMTAVAKPLPSRVFVEMVLHAPAGETKEITRLANVASTPTTQEGREARGAMLRWINDFVDRRREQEPLDDVVDAVIAAEVEGRPSRGALRRLREGVDLEDGRTAPARVSLLGDHLLRLVIHEGRNRQVRRMCEAVGHPVTRLVRTRIGPLADRTLAPGEWRELTGAEVQELRLAAVAADERIDGGATDPATGGRR